MNKVFGRILVIGLATATITVAGIAYADGFGHGHHHGEGSLVPPIVRQYVTHDQMKAAFAPNAAQLKSDYLAVKTARQTLESDLIAGNSNVPSDVQALQTAQNNLLQEKVTVAEAILANLSSSQRTQVGNFVTAYRALQETNAQNRTALFQQYGIGWGAGSSDSSAPAATE
ncbi:MAG: hypothetical protein ABSG46_00595 [Candidatus Binataceae bacterium]